MGALKGALKIIAGLAGLLIAFACLWLMVLAVGMALVESHPLHGSDIAALVVVLVIEFLVACAGGVLALYAARSAGIFR